MRLAGEVALITGSSRGKGLAIAERFASEGAAVVITGRSRATGEQAVARIVAAGGVATFVPLNVSHEHEVQGAVKEAVRSFGRLTVLVNNAAPSEYAFGPQAITKEIKDLDTDQWRLPEDVARYS